MKNREYKKLVAIAMAAALAAGSFYTVPSMAAGETAIMQEAKQKVLKDETVYAKIDGNGNVKSVTVSDQLKNVEDKKKIQDVSSLKEIQNVKGDEKFTQKGESVVWKGDGQNLCYQGTSTEELPVKVKISYRLDGKEMTAEELKGKSGHLTIRYDYENLTGTKEQAYIPFVMATGVVLDDEKFQNITVENGKVISDGERNVVLGMGIPGMKEALGTEEAEIPDFFEIQADVTKYEAVPGITAASNELFNELDTEKFDEISDLKNALHKLQDASKQLVSGSGELKEGLDTLLQSSGTLTGGIDRLMTGGADLKNGTEVLTRGSSELAAGNKALAEGTGQLLEGTKTLHAGAGELNSGLKTAADKTQNILLPGVKQLDDGVGNMQKEVGDGISTLGSGIHNLHTSLGRLREGTAGLNAVLNQGTAETGNVSLKAISEKTAADAAGFGNTDEAAEMLRQLAESNPEVKDAVEQILVKLNENQNAAVQVAQEAGMVSAIVNRMADAAVQTDTGMTQAESGMAQLDTAVNDSKEGLGIKVMEGLRTLKQGTASLRGGIDGEEGLANGLGKLSAGAKAVNDGSDQLSQKMGEADAGAKGAAKGASQAEAGAKQLNGGMAVLYSGLYTLQSGSGQLIDGVRQLDAGAGELQKGMQKLQEEGIEKLVQVFDGDIEGLLNKFNEMSDASKQYRNFSGISEEMDGQVKFIFVTE